MWYYSYFDRNYKYQYVKEAGSERLTIKMRSLINVANLYGY